MGLACNIDRRGRSIRAVAGTLVLLVGIALLLALLASGTAAGEAESSPRPLERRELGLLIGGASACMGGAFMLFEGLVGWCAVRAMGFRTPV